MFKKIRLDLFDKAIIIAALCAIIFALWYFFRKSTTIEIVIRLDQIESRYDAWVENIGTKSWFSEGIEIGDLEKDGLGSPRAEILDIVAYDIDLKKQLVFSKVKIKATYTKATNSYNFKGRPVAIGEPITLNLERRTVRGIVTEVEGAKNPRQPVSLTIDSQIIYNDASHPNTSGVDAYVSDAIQKGDLIYDYKQQPIIKVLEKTVKPAKTIITTDRGDLISKANPRYQDISLKLQINGYKMGGKYYLIDDVPISIGYFIPLNFTDITVFPTVTSITENSNPQTPLN